MHTKKFNVDLDCITKVSFITANYCFIIYTC